MTNVNEKTVIGAVLCGALGLAACAGPQANAPLASAPPEPAQFGVLVMAHGGTPEWNAAVEHAVSPLRAKYPVEIAFGMADAATIQEGVRALEARHVNQIGVVRLFISGESWHERTEQILGLREGAPPAGTAHTGHGGHDAQGEHAMHAGHGEHAMHAGHGEHAMHAGHGERAAHDAHASAAGSYDTYAGMSPEDVAAMAAVHGRHSMAFFRIATHASFAVTSDGLADAETMGKVLADRATALSKDPAHEDVLVLAHGPGDDGENERWLAKLDARAEAIRALGPFRRVQVETLREDWPNKRAVAVQRIRDFVARARQEGGTAIVIPYRVQGFGPYKQVLDGLEYVSDGQGLMPHPAVEAWIAHQAEMLRAGPFRPTLAP